MYSRLNRLQSWSLLWGRLTLRYNDRFLIKCDYNIIEIMSVTKFIIYLTYSEKSQCGGGQTKTCVCPNVQ